MVYFDGSRWVLGNENGAVIVSAEIDLSPATNVTWPSDINVTRYNSAIDIFNEGNVEVISIQDIAPIFSGAELAAAIRLIDYMYNEKISKDNIVYSIMNGKEQT